MPDNNPSLLAIDVGNSRVKFGLFQPRSKTETSQPWPECLEFLAIPVTDPVPRETLLSWTNGGQVPAVISGSNPPVIQHLLDHWDLSAQPPLAVRHCSSIPVHVDVDFPDRVGLDRLLNTVAVNAIRSASRPVIIIDSGTATTVDYVSSEGVFCGGAILPGMELGAKSLHLYTALLPLLSVQELGGTNLPTPGRNTRDAMRNGLFWGQVGAIRELIKQICLQRQHANPEDASADSNRTPWLVLTGGGGPVLSSQFPRAERLPSLGMHGLVLTAWRHLGPKG